MRSILVKTGHGMKELEKKKIDGEIFESLYEFAQKLKAEKG
jgi:hypothetical protein